jgi:hypothetical protein
LNLFKQDDKIDKVGIKRGEPFHTLVAKGLLLSKTARPNTLPVITYLYIFVHKVKQNNENNWFKLSKLVRFLKLTINDELTIEVNDFGKITRCVDATFGVHKDMKSQTGVVMMLEKESCNQSQQKQKVNSASSIEAG